MAVNLTKKEDKRTWYKNLKVQNKNLLSKWLWRFVVEDQKLWRRVILNKYGKNEG